MVLLYDGSSVFLHLVLLPGGCTYKNSSHLCMQLVYATTGLSLEAGRVVSKIPSASTNWTLRLKHNYHIDNNIGYSNDGTTGRISETINNPNGNCMLFQLLGC